VDPGRSPGRWETGEPRALPALAPGGAYRVSTLRLSGSARWQVIPSPSKRSRFLVAGVRPGSSLHVIPLIKRQSTGIQGLRSVRALASLFTRTRYQHCMLSPFGRDCIRVAGGPSCRRRVTPTWRALCPPRPGRRSCPHVTVAGPGILEAVGQKELYRESLTSVPRGLFAATREVVDQVPGEQEAEGCDRHVDRHPRGDGFGPPLDGEG
jgi:hypothetical protein